MTGLWRLSPAWLEVLEQQAVGELHRLQQGLSFRLGELLLSPWRVVNLLKGTSPPVRSQRAWGAPLAPPYPLPREGGLDPTELKKILEALQALWVEVDGFERRPAFRLGAALRALRAGPSQAAGMLRRPAPHPVEARPDLRLFGQRPPGAWRALAPDWLAEMWQTAGVTEPEPSSSAEPLLLCLDGRPEMEGEMRTLQARLASLAGRDGAPVCAWWVAGRPRPELLALCQAPGPVFAVPDQQLRLSQALGRPVEALAPAIAPRLHNPIGHWHGASHLGVQGRHEALAPPAWRRLFARARGTGSSETPVRLGRVRQLHRAETLRRRLAFIAGEQPTGPAVSAMACSRRPTEIPHLLEQLANQRALPIELQLGLHGPGFDRRRVQAAADRLPFPVHCHTFPPELPLGGGLQQLAEACGGRYLARFDDDDRYGPWYLEDQLQALAFSDAGVVGKASFVVRFLRDGSWYWCNPEQEFRYVPTLAGGATMVVRREVLERTPFPSLSRGEDTAFFQAVRRLGVPLLGTAHPGYVCQRREPGRHTWRVRKQQLLAAWPTRKLPGPPGMGGRLA